MQPGCCAVDAGANADHNRVVSSSQGGNPTCSQAVYDIICAAVVVRSGEHTKLASHFRAQSQIASTSHGIVSNQSSWPSLRAGSVSFCIKLLAP